MKVYIIEGHYDYEGGPILAVYAARESADLEKARLKAVKASEPDMPPVDEDWGGYREKRAAWEKGLYNGSNYHSYHITEMGVQP